MQAARSAEAEIGGNTAVGAVEAVAGLEMAAEPERGFGQWAFHPGNPQNSRT